MLGYCGDMDASYLPLLIKQHDFFSIFSALQMYSGLDIP